jgi:hypothetical protein
MEMRSFDKNVRNFDQKSLQALLARLQLFEGLGSVRFGFAW